MHGGAPGSGAPFGRRNGNYRHGHFTAAAKEQRRRLKSLIRDARKMVRSHWFEALHGVDARFRLPPPPPAAARAADELTRSLRLLQHARHVRLGAQLNVDRAARLLADPNCLTKNIETNSARKIIDAELLLNGAAAVSASRRRDRQLRRPFIG
jgi:hypothetical protein